MFRNSPQKTPFSCRKESRENKIHSEFPFCEAFFIPLPFLCFILYYNSSVNAKKWLSALLFSHLPFSPGAFLRFYEVLLGKRRGEKKNCYMIIGYLYLFEGTSIYSRIN